MVVSGKTKVYGVIGDPIEHSLSPALQNAAFEALGYDSMFLAFRVKSVEVGNALSGMRALGINGLNVTMPHKSSVIPHLDELDKTVRFLNAVNTIQNKNGKLLGFNTDGIGAMKALRENGVNPKGKKVLLLGAGGASRAIAFTIAHEADELVILNRTVKPAKDLAIKLRQLLPKKISADELSTKAIKENLVDSEILINATSIGMKPNTNETPINPIWLRSNMAVMDIVYNPIETKLATIAKEAGAKVVSGVEMLIYQGAASFEIWTGKPAPIQVMRKAALDRLQRV